MNIEMYATLAFLGIGVSVWAITLDELIDTVDDVADKAKETKEEVREILADVE